MASSRPPADPSPPRTPPRRPASTLPAPTSEPSPVLDPEARPLPESQRLPPHRDKLERVTDHVAAISADLQEWVELRIALVKRQVEGLIGIKERVEHLAEAAKLAVPGLILVVIGLLFLLVTIALALGQWWGSYALGFLAVTTVLVLVGLVLLWLGKRRYDAAEAIVAEAKRVERDRRSISRDGLAAAQRKTAQPSAT
ncbi:MAG: phage holin family protein [Bacteroidota bacterium]